MDLEEFLRSDDRLSVERRPEADALREVDAHAESALVDLRASFVESSVWVLLDCRGSLHVSEANTAAVVLRGVTHVSWELPRTGTFAWQTVGDWRVGEVDGGVELFVGLLAGGEVTVRAAGAEYFVGDVPGGDEPPPDFTTASPAEVHAGMAGWSSEFRPVAASFR